jgi:predicted RNA-binding protein with PUA-like domain
MAYWLLKSDPDSYAWERLVKEGRTRWDGVRNHQAAGYLKAMKRGERAFFYHSGGESALVGVVEIASESEPDPGDPTGRFVMVGVRPVQPLARPVALSQIRATPALKDMALLRQGRLSVVPVAPEAWALLCRMGGVKP